MTTPGLLWRKAIAQSENGVLVHEAWDITAEGCPVIQMPRWDGSTRTPEETVVYVERKYTVPAEQWEIMK
jgi:hypothetical protein